MVPQTTPASRHLRWLVLSALLCSSLCFGSAPRPPRPNEPVISLPLEDLGYTSPPPHTLESGGSPYTLHFVDPTHLLFTFNSRGLLARLPDASPDDNDRNVTAVLLELPSGKILARTVWRTRDRDQYIWPLTRGRFLLRIRNKLTVIQPLENLGHEEPFYQQPFLELKRRIAFIAVSPGGDLLTVETAPARPPAPSPAVLAAALAAQMQAQAKAQAQSQSQTPYQPQLQRRNAGPPIATSTSTSTAGGSPQPAPPQIELLSDAADRPPVQLHFFRLFIDSKPGEPPRLAAQSAGVLAARTLINVAATAEGFLDVLKESERVYNFDFQSHTGKRVELSAYDTSCSPRPYFVSRSEFVAFGCHGSPDKIQLSGFNLKGEEPWVSVFSGQHIAPAIVTAPEASRFALSRILVSANGYIDPENIQSAELTSQEITVMQNHDGRTLLKLQVAPVQRTSQNFDISSDGLAFTVVRSGNIEVYHLPALTAADRKDLNIALAAVPEKNDALVRLNSAKIAVSATASAANMVPSASVEDIATTHPEAQPAPAPAATLGDAPPEGPRKPPTLYDPDHPKPPDR